MHFQPSSDCQGRLAMFSMTVTGSKAFSLVSVPVQSSSQVLIAVVRPVVLAGLCCGGRSVVVVDPCCGCRSVLWW